MKSNAEILHLIACLNKKVDECCDEPGNPGILPTGGAWMLLGNAGTTDSNFLGTTDNQALVLRTNDERRFVIDELGIVTIEYPTLTSDYTSSTSFFGTGINDAHFTGAYDGSSPDLINYEVTITTNGSPVQVTTAYYDDALVPYEVSGVGAAHLVHMENGFLNDLTFSGTYNGGATTPVYFEVWITSTNQFSWKEYDYLGNVLNMGVSTVISGAAQSLYHGIFVTFHATSGFTPNTGTFYIIPNSGGLDTYTWLTNEQRDNENSSPTQYNLPLPTEDTLLANGVGVFFETTTGHTYGDVWQNTFTEIDQSDFPIFTIEGTTEEADDSFKVSSIGDISFAGGIIDENETRGTAGQILSSTGDRVEWIDGIEQIIYTAGDGIYISPEYVISALPDNDTGTGLLSPGYVSWSGTGLTFNVTAAEYSILGVVYNSPDGTITLDPADPALPRYDVIGVDVNGDIIKITGEPNMNPAIPQVDPDTQLHLTAVFVDAGATTPTEIENEIIYDEDTEQWTPSAPSFVSADFTNTDTTYHENISANLSEWASARNVIFDLESGTIAPANYALFLFHIFLKGPATANVRVFFSLGTVVVSNTVIATTSNGFNRLTTGVYQNVVIPMTAFTFTDTEFDRVTIRFAGSGDGAFLDYVRLQNGTFLPSPDTIQIVGTNGITVTPDIAQTLFSNPSFTVDGSAMNLQQVLDNGNTANQTLTLTDGTDSIQLSVGQLTITDGADTVHLRGDNIVGTKTLQLPNTDGVLGRSVRINSTTTNFDNNGLANLGTVITSVTGNIVSGTTSARVVTSPVLVNSVGTLYSVGTFADEGSTSNDAKNIILGYGAGYTGLYNSIAIGETAGLQSHPATNTILIGKEAGAINGFPKVDTVGIGYQVADGNHNRSVNIGYQAGRLSNHVGSINIGEQAGGTNSGQTLTHHIAIGYFAGWKSPNGHYSINIGYQAGKASTTDGQFVGAHGIAIGTNVSVGNNITGGLNIGSVIFGTGLHTDTSSIFPSTSPTASGKIGIMQNSPQNVLHVGNNASLATGYTGIRVGVTSATTPLSTSTLALSVDASGDVGLYEIDALTEVGGENTAVQFNNNGTLGGDENFFAWDSEENRLFIGSAVDDVDYDSRYGVLNIQAPSASAPATYNETFESFHGSTIDDADFSQSYSGVTNKIFYAWYIDGTPFSLITNEAFFNYWAFVNKTPFVPQEILSNNRIDNNSNLFGITFSGSFSGSSSLLPVYFEIYHDGVDTEFSWTEYDKDGNVLNSGTDIPVDPDDPILLADGISINWNGLTGLVEGDGDYYIIPPTDPTYIWFTNETFGYIPASQMYLPVVLNDPMPLEDGITISFEGGTHEFGDLWLLEVEANNTTIIRTIANGGNTLFEVTTSGRVGVGKDLPGNMLDIANNPYLPGYYSGLRLGITSATPTVGALVKGLGVDINGDVFIGEFPIPETPETPTWEDTLEEQGSTAFSNSHLINLGLENFEMGNTAEPNLFFIGSAEGIPVAAIGNLADNCYFLAAPTVGSIGGKAELIELQSGDSAGGTAHSDINMSYSSTTTATVAISASNSAASSVRLLNVGENRTTITKNGGVEREIVTSVTANATTYYADTNGDVDLGVISGATPTLQEVTDEDNITTNALTVVDVSDNTIIEISNNSGIGQLKFGTSSPTTLNVTTETIVGTKTIKFPNATGTLPITIIVDSTPFTADTTGTIDLGVIGGGGGSGTVTSIGTANGLTGGPITGSGTISGVDALADGSTKGVAAFVAADFNSSSGIISIDYANAQSASGSLKGFLTSADWTTFNNKVATTRAINTTSPLSGGGNLSADRTISIADAAADGTTKGAAAFTATDFNATAGIISIDYTNGQSASGSTKGFLTSTDWTTFNNKVPTARAIATTAPLSGGGDLSANRTLSIADAVADGATKGAAAFTASDFNSAAGVISIDYTNGQAASGSTKGFLTSADFTIFSNKLSNITGLITQGTNVTITGSGTSGSPYVINASPGGGGSGTVNTGTINTLAYYPANGTTVDNLPAITPDSILISDSSGLPVAANTSIYPTLTEFAFGKGVTSNIQTQLTAKVPTSRTITTTAPLTGGGALSANLTLAITDASADGSTKGVATFAASEFNATGGVISLDYTNAQAASAVNKGFLTAADWSTFNAKQTALSGTGYSKWAGTSVSYLTPTQVTADLNVFTQTLKGLVPAPVTAGTTRFLREDGTWSDPAGAGTVSTGAINRLAYYAAAGTTVDDLAAIVANRILVSNASGLPIAADTATYPSLAELAFVKGVTSSIQDQIDAIGGGSSGFDEAIYTVNPTGTTFPFNGGLSRINFKMTLAANSNITFTSMTIGRMYYLTIIQGGTGGHSLQFPTNTKFPLGAASPGRILNTTTTAGAEDDIAIKWDGANYRIYFSKNLQTSP